MANNSLLLNISMSFGVSSFLASIYFLALIWAYISLGRIFGRLSSTTMGIRKSRSAFFSLLSV